MNIPILGKYLFGGNSKDKSRSELLVAIIPHIVRKPDIDGAGSAGRLCRARSEPEAAVLATARGGSHGRGHSGPGGTGGYSSSSLVHLGGGGCTGQNCAGLDGARFTRVRSQPGLQSGQRAGALGRSGSGVFGSWPM